MQDGTLVARGRVGLEVVRVPRGLWPILREALPFTAASPEARAWRWRNMPSFLSGYTRLAVASLTQRWTGIPILYGVLSAVVTRADGSRVNYGVLSVQKVTVAAVNYIATRLVDANTSIGNFDFHGFGTGTGAESNGDTALGTEFTTQYATDNTRPTGSPTNPSANVYQTVATFSPDTGGTLAVTEHGVFSQAATGGGTLLDRSVFSAINLVAGSDSITTTYQLTLQAEA